MAADNHTTIVGNLVEEPEVRFTNTGIAVANLRVAVTQRVQQDGQWRDGDTSFFKVNVWRGQVEHLAESLGKGDRVMVTGRLRQRSWETPEGDKRSVTELEAPRRSAPASSGPRPRSSGPASAATATALRDGNGRPNAAATSTTPRRFSLAGRLASGPGSSRGPTLGVAPAAAAGGDRLTWGEVVLVADPGQEADGAPAGGEGALGAGQACRDRSHRRAGTARASPRSGPGAPSLEATVSASAGIAATAAWLSARASAGRYGGRFARRCRAW
jgi:single-strand DNA-binding protein